MTAIEFYPVSAPLVRFETGKHARYRLVALDGLGPVDVGPSTIKSPSQVGVTAVDVAVPPRVVTVQGIIQANDLADLWRARGVLAASLPARPVAAGQTQQLGRLRILRDPLAPLEVLVIPISSHLPAPKSAVGILPFDLEFMAPQPDWRTTQDAISSFASAGGFTFAIQLPLTIASNNIRQELINDGDVSTPIVAQLYGACTDPVFKNETTGEQIRVTGAVNAGDYIEISTAFEDKRVELVSGATRTNILSRLDIASSTFWQMRPGVNAISFTASVNTSGRAVLYWRTRYGGL